VGSLPDGPTRAVSALCAPVIESMLGPLGQRAAFGDQSLAEGRVGTEPGAGEDAWRFRKSPAKTRQRSLFAACSTPLIVGPDGRIELANVGLEAPVIDAITSRAVRQEGGDWPVLNQATPRG
jgi:hypothetical protein